MGIKELLEKFAEDKEFAAKYLAFSSLDDALEEAKKDGYSIMKEEALAALQSKRGGELSDEELASVAGGKDQILCSHCGSANIGLISIESITYYCRDCRNRFFG